METRRTTGVGYDSRFPKTESPAKSGASNIGRVWNKLAHNILTHISVPVVATVNTAMAATVHQTQTFPIFSTIALMFHPPIALILILAESVSHPLHTAAEKPYA